MLTILICFFILFLLIFINYFYRLQLEDVCFDGLMASCDVKGQNGISLHCSFVHTDLPSFALGSWVCWYFPVVICQVAVFGVQFPHNNPRLLFNAGRNDIAECCGLIGALSIGPLVTQIAFGSLSRSSANNPARSHSIA